MTTRWIVILKPLFKPHVANLFLYYVFKINKISLLYVPKSCKNKVLLTKLNKLISNYIYTILHQWKKKTPQNTIFIVIAVCKLLIVGFLFCSFKKKNAQFFFLTCTCMSTCFQFTLCYVKLIINILWTFVSVYYNLSYCFSWLKWVQDLNWIANCLTRKLE